MTGKTHVAVGVMTTAAIAVLKPKGFDVLGAHVIPVLSILSAVPGSKLPDIDIQQSSMGRRHKFISRMLKHRGFTHTLIIPLVLLAILFILGRYVRLIYIIEAVLGSLVFGILVGWVMHIFADMFNKKGVPLLYPISSGHLHIATVKTRHWTEKAWLGLFTVVVVGITLLLGGYI